MTTKTKKKAKGGFLYRLIMLVLICIMAFCLYKIGTIVYEYYKGAKAYDAVAELAGLGDGLPREVDFDILKKQNPDVVGWIYSKDTPINYPVVQGKDNEKYLYQMFNEEWNGKGSIFVDYTCEQPFAQFNTIVYGHRMKDGSMFHSLTKYREKDYYEKHKTLQLLTPSQNYDIEVFGVVTLPADSDMYRMTFSGEEDEQSYIDWILANTETEMDVKPTAADNIVMLSTCTYEFDDARLVVFGRLKEKTEEKKR